MKITKEQVLKNIEDVKKYIEEAENKAGEKVVGIAIKNRWTGEIIFQSTKTTYKEAVEERLASEADLRSANLCGADLSEANLSGADLSGADLSEADLRGANLRDADLSRTDLRDAELYVADLRGADLRGAELMNAKFYGRGGARPLTRAQLPDFLAALGFVIED